MKTLVVEDDFTCRLLLQRLLAPYGESHIAVDGREAMQAFESCFGSAEAYDAIFLDIMMPEMDGHEVLQKIRSIEDAAPGPVRRAKIVMTTALSDKRNVFSAFREQCDAYLPKPIHKEKLHETLVELGLVR